MKILVTGAKGFVGKNLCQALKNVRDGKDRTRGELSVEEVFEYDLDSTAEELEAWCAEADFVFNLAGVNRPQNQEEFMAGNFGFASTLLDTLRKHGNNCPVMLSSSQQASLTGRFGDSEYGRSKKAGEDLFLRYGEEIAGKAGDEVRNPGLRPRVLVYRFPNLFGKWCRPNYNSAVATFCNAVANDLPYTVNDPSVELELLYIDDFVDEMFAALAGREHRCEFNGLDVIPTPSVIPCDSERISSVIPSAPPVIPSAPSVIPSAPSVIPSAPSVIPSEAKESLGRYCYVPVTHHATLGEIVDLLHSFAEQPATLMMPEIPAGSFAKKLYSTYLSYLPASKVAFPLKTNADARGSFTELVKTIGGGQFSVNISKPGVTKGQHWHNTKWEFFIVVSGKALIQERRIGSDEILNFEVSGKEIKAVHMLPGYTHNIINLSDTEPLITLMWANEPFDPAHPDTFFEPVE